MAHYTATATAIAGRNGHVETSDGVLKFELSIPKEIGGPGKAGATNPEQLFACGYAACFGSALDHVARLKKLHPSEVKVTAEVTLNVSEEKGFYLSAVLRIGLAGLDHAQAEALAAEAHTVCPYSKATSGNIDVELIVA